MTDPNNQGSRVTISIPAALADKVDEQAAKEYRTRSELVREALRLYLKRQAVLEDVDVTLAESAELRSRLASHASFEPYDAVRKALELARSSKSPKRA